MKKTKQYQLLSTFAAALVALLVQFAAPSAFAVTNYWDNDGATAGFGTAAGTWADPTIGDGTQGWSTDATGGTVPVNVTTTTNDVLLFGFRTNSLAGGIITVSGAVEANQLNFGGPPLLGPIILTNGTSITLGGASPVITTTNTGNVIWTPIFLAPSNSTASISFSRRASLAGTLTLNGVISGSGGLRFTTPNVNSGGALQTVLLGSANNYTGDTEITTGNVNNNTTVKAGVDNTLPTNTVLTLDGGNGAGTGRVVSYDLNGRNQTLAGLDNHKTRTLRFQRIYNTSATPGILTINNTNNYTFSGSLGSTIANGNFGLTKNGSGTLALANTNAYTGDTTISAGMLALASGGTIASSANIIVGTEPASAAILDVTAAGITIGASQTLSGHGTVNGSVTVNGTVAPGTSIGTLTFGTAPTLNGTLLMEIDRNGGTPLADQIVGLGGLGGTLTVNNIGATLVNGDTFTLFNAGNSGSFAATTLPHGPAHWNLTALNSAGTITFVNTSPLAQDLTHGVSQGNSATLPIIGGKNSPTDAEGDALTVTGVTQPSEGSVTFTSSSVTYDATGAAGTHTYSYTVSDPFGATDTRTVTVVVTPFSSTGANIVPGSFSITGGNNVQLQAFGIPGVTYRLEYTADLNAPIVWVDLPSSDVVAGTNGAISFNYTHSESLPGSGFFRTKYVSGP